MISAPHRLAGDTAAPARDVAAAACRPSQWWARALLASAVFTVAPHHLPAQGTPISVEPRWSTEAWHSLSTPFTLALNRRLTPEAGSLRVFVGEVEVTALLEPQQLLLTYPARLKGVITAGEHRVKVFLDSPTGEWVELGSFPLRLRTRAGFEQARIAPTLDLAGEGRWEGEDGSDAPVQSDLGASLNATLASEHRRGTFSLESSFAVVGVPERPAALRFAELGEDAPLVDLSSYLVEARLGGATLSVGHLQFGRHRLVAQGFSARGVSASVPIARGVSLELAATGGSSQVGWSDLVSLSERQHQMRSATLQLEFFPTVPGVARLALTWLDGSLLPRSGFDRGAVVAAERSRGGGAQLHLALPSGRLGLEAGWARMRLDDGFDAELEEGLAVEPVASSTSSGHYAELQATLLEGRLGEQAQGALRLALQHQRLDPLYRSVAASTQADVDQRAGQLMAQLGSVTVQGSWERTVDNLNRLPTVLGSHGERHGVNLALPLPQLLSTSWLPSLQAGWDRSRARGLARDDSLFPPDTVPDLDTTSRSASLDWGVGAWQVGYRWSRSLTDNRNPAQAQADLKPTSHQITVARALGQRMNVSLDASRDETRELGSGQQDRSHRLGLATSLRLGDALGCSVNLSHSTRRSLPEGAENTGIDGDVQLSYRFSLGLPGGQGGASLRLARRHQTTLSPLFGVDEDTRQWSASLGVSVSLAP